MIKPVIPYNQHNLPNEEIFCNSLRSTKTYMWSLLKQSKNNDYIL